MKDENPFERGFTTVIWEFLVSQFSRPIRRSIIVACGLLSVVVTLSKVLLGIDLREAVLGSYFLTALAVAAVTLAIQFLRHAKGVQRVLGVLILLIVAIPTGFRAWDEWKYRYLNGIAVQRSWTEVGRNQDRCAMTLKLKALSSDSANLHLLTKVNPEKCPSVHILDLHPTSDPQSGLYIHGAENVATQIAAEWTFTGFARPATMDLRLVLKGIDGSLPPQHCVTLLLDVRRAEENQNSKSEEGKNDAAR